MSSTAATLYNPSNLPSNDNINDYSYCVDVRGQMFVRNGKMIAYYGQLRFEALGSVGLAGLVNRAFNSASYVSDFIVINGQGKLIIGDNGNNIASYNLENGNLTVKADNLLAFEDTLRCQESVVEGYLTIIGSGLFLASSCGPVMFAVPPICVDEQALLGWADTPCPSYRYDYSYVQSTLSHIGAMVGIGASGEEKQLEFKKIGNDDMVLIQSSESNLKGRDMLTQILAMLPGLDQNDAQAVYNNLYSRLHGNR